MEARFAPELRPYQRCRCGSCGDCVEDDRWDRIFAKFDLTRQPMPGATTGAMTVAMAGVAAGAGPKTRPEAGPRRLADRNAPAYEEAAKLPSPLPDGWAGVWARMTDEELESAARDYVWLAANAPGAGQQRWEGIVAESERRRRPAIVARAKAQRAKAHEGPGGRMPAPFRGRGRRPVVAAGPPVVRAGEPYF